MIISRRALLSCGRPGLLLLALLLAPVLPAAEPPPLFRDGERILFQGDSITDMGRGRTADPNHILGHGYAFLIAADQGAAFPERHLTFLNRGVSGNKVVDLEKRWQSDTLDLQPDVLSILIGVNDLNRPLAQGQPPPLEEYEQNYDALLARTRAALPDVKLILGEPFFLRGRHSENNYDAWVAAMAEMRAIVARLGEKYHAPVVHFQQVFDDACARAPVEYWIWDGIHPTYSGHRLMADAWVRTYAAYYGLTPPARAAAPAAPRK